MANLMRRDPFRDMLTLRSAMDRMFDSALFGGTDMESQDLGSLAMDVAENEDDYVVKVSVPGVKPEDLDITYTGRTLTVRGETQEDNETEESRYHLRERRFGRFARSITLPTNINADQIEANCENGILTLRLPKAEEAKPKRIEVRSDKMIEGKSRDVKVESK